MIKSKNSNSVRQVLRDLKNPPPMSFERALAQPNPSLEVRMRFHFDEAENLLPIERIWWASECFLGDTLNGSLHQAMSNSSGDSFYDVFQFVQTFCSPSLLKVFEELAAGFPGGVVPRDREKRNNAIETMPDQWLFFDTLTEKFDRLQEDYGRGLAALLRAHGQEFVHYRPEGGAHKQSAKDVLEAREALQVLVGMLCHVEVSCSGKPSVEQLRALQQWAVKPRRGLLELRKVLDGGTLRIEEVPDYVAADCQRSLESAGLSVRIVPLTVFEQRKWTLD